MNTVQENISAIYNIRKIRQDDILEETRFEQHMFASNPALYRDYMKRKQEDVDNGNANVTWIAPESVEEARQMMDLFADIDQRMKNNTEESAANEEFVKQMGLMDLLGGINVDEIGDD